MEAVIFDLDNTLINRKLAFRAYTEKFIDRFVHVADGSDRNDIIERMIQADRNGYRKKRELYKELRTVLPMKDEEAAVEEMLEHWFSEFFKCSILMEGAIELLDRLKADRMKLGMITNGSVRAQNAKIDKVGIRHYFDTIIISDEVGMKKPDVAIFQLALERLNTSADRTMFVGDHPVNDMMGAAGAGLRGVWLRGFMERDTASEEPEYAIDGLSELAALMETMEDEGMKA